MSIQINIFHCHRPSFNKEKHVWQLFGQNMFKQRMFDCLFPWSNHFCSYDKKQEIFFLILLFMALLPNLRNYRVNSARWSKIYIFLFLRKILEVLDFNFFKLCAQMINLWHHQFCKRAIEIVRFFESDRNCIWIT